MQVWSVALLVSYGHVSQLDRGPDLFCDSDDRDGFA